MPVRSRTAVAEMLTRRYNGPAYDPEKEVLITVGVSEAMSLIMQAILDPGDEVIVPQPCFVSYTASVLLAGGTVVDLPTYADNNFRGSCRHRSTDHTQYQSTFDRLPSVPTGAVMVREGLLQIARIAEAHDLIVISDEIYDRLVYGDHEHVMFAALPDMAERKVHLGGMSKDYAMTGWRAEATPVVRPGSDRRHMRKIHQYLIMSASTVGQEAALAALTDPTAEEYVLQMVASYDARRRLIVDGMNSPVSTVSNPKGPSMLSQHPTHGDERT
ncbi:MAG: pyridoxal phosphate-dependent aminotransferase [Caldilineaceae bacterium]